MLASAPELAIGGVLAAGGLGLGCFFDLVLLPAALVTTGVFLIWYLRPSVHSMAGYGMLAEGQALPTCTPQGTVLIRGSSFVDEFGRTLLLRGVNLSGASKLPASPPSVTSTSIQAAGSNFYDHANVSFVGRPFPLTEADEHFARLRLWGLTFLRLLITWEAVEHGGPGQYDTEYLEYLLQLVRKAAAHGISVFIDPHMDTWSRFSGGDGAPGWTLEAAGFDVRAIHASGAATLHQVRTLHPSPYTRTLSAPYQAFLIYTQHYRHLSHRSTAARCLL